MDAIFFANQDEFRDWLREYHDRETELWLETDRLQYFDPETGRSLAVKEHEPVAA